MLWVWLMIVGSLALASYLWMRIDEAQQAASKARPDAVPQGAGTRGPRAASADATRRA